MKILKQYAEQITEVALARANASNPQHHSDHEAIAVLYEEVLEARREVRILRNVEKEMNAIIRNTGCTWSCVMTDRHDTSEKYVEKIRKHAINLIAEAAQVAAMCDKYTGRTGEEEK